MNEKFHDYLFVFHSTDENKNSINDNINNRVVTATGNGPTPFQGEENLTFDGTNLTVGGKIFATEIVTNIVSQSISFATGSTRFGDTTADTPSTFNDIISSISLFLIMLSNCLP